MPFIFQDEDVLNREFRVKIIKEITSPENVNRKKISSRRHQIFRDKTLEHVLQRLKDQGFKDSTITQMRARGSNISIYKKVIKKKARAYVSGVERTVRTKDGKIDDVATKDVQIMAELLNVTQAFRRGDEFREMTKNALLYCYPQAVSVDPNTSLKIWTLATRVLMAHQFDAIPDAQNHEVARCIILSDYPAGLQEISQDRGVNGYRDPQEGTSGGDGFNQVIANSPSDQGAGAMRFVWWTGKFHFTTDGNGEYVRGMQMDDGRNLVGMLPFVDLFKDQDGEFWGQGGDDLTEGAILVNTLLTDMAGILSAQGWGQPVLTELARKGSEGGAPPEVEVGPHNLIRLPIDENGNAGKFELVSTDPHTEEWLKAVEVYVALLLTTNNLSPRNISGKLDANNVASGIAKMIDEAESTEDLSEAQQYFARKEQTFWTIANRWLDALRPTGRLIEPLKAVKPFGGELVNATFKQQGTVLSDAERQDLIKKRKEVGLTLMQELIKMDKPNLTDKEALEYLEQVLTQRKEIQAKDPTLLAAESSTTTVKTDQEIPGQGGGSPPPKPASGKPEAKT